MFVGIGLKKLNLLVLAVLLTVFCAGVSEASEVCQGDIDRNGTVDVDDIVAIVLDFGACIDGPCASDDNGDGQINIDDIQSAVLNFGECECNASTDYIRIWNEVQFDTAIRNDLAGSFMLCDNLNLGSTEHQSFGGLGEAFTGVFDGNGKTISGLSMYCVDSFCPAYSAMFSVLNGASVRNIVFEYPYLNGGAWLGTLASFVFDSEIDNITIIGAHLNDGLNGSGLLAAVVHNSIISNVNADGEIWADGPVGGLVSEAAFGVQISNSHVNGIVAGQQRVGGLVGTGLATTIEQSSFTGETSENSGSFYGRIGGLVGYLLPQEAVDYPVPYEGGGSAIFQSKATGYVGSTNGYAGGLVGVLGSPVDGEFLAVVEDCFTDVLVLSSPFSLGVGGIVGSINTGSVSNAVAVGTSSGSGVVGLVSAHSVVLDSFFDSSIEPDVTIDENNVGLETALLQTLSTFSNWNISLTSDVEQTVWKLSADGNAYPVLSWELEGGSTSGPDNSSAKEAGSNEAAMQPTSR